VPATSVAVAAKAAFGEGIKWDVPAL